MHTATNKSAIAESGIVNLFKTRDDACPSRRKIDFFYFVGRLFSGTLVFFYIHISVIFITLRNLSYTLIFFQFKNPEAVFGL